MLTLKTTWSAFSTVIEHRMLVPSFSLHWLYWITGALISSVAYRRRGPMSPRSFAQFLFPRSVWLHSSAVVDYSFFVITVPIFSLLVMPMLLTERSVSDPVQVAMHGWGGHAGATAPTLTMAFIYTAVLVLAADFKHYWLHRAMHEVPALWEFHKVHHSAEVLTPFTAYRAHPLEMLLQALGEVLVSGVVTGVFLACFSPSLTPLSILGVNAGRFAFYVLGVNLQHSHIFLSFGSTVEHFVISPAQHQIHHSAETRHHGRNFGLKLAVWDWMFGTLWCPAPGEKFAFGLGARETGCFDTVTDLYLTPFRAQWTRTRPAAIVPVDYPVVASADLALGVLPADSLFDSKQPAANGDGAVPNAVAKTGH